jgi:hypothetical protein
MEKDDNHENSMGRNNLWGSELFARGHTKVLADS